jgi:hypothetical protein
MSLIFATQLTAVATVVLAVFAIVTAFYARQAFRRQSREVVILAEQNEREIRDRRRDQATRVFIWAEAGTAPDPQDQTVPGLVTHVKNASDRPVYDGLIRIRDASRPVEGRPFIPVFLALMPGDQVDTAHGFTEPVPVPLFWQDNSRLRATVRFRDAAGVHWQLGTSGQLAEIPAPEDERPALT